MQLRSSAAQSELTVTPHGRLSEHTARPARGAAGRGQCSGKLCGTLRAETQQRLQVAAPAHAVPPWEVVERAVSDGSTAKEEEDNLFVPPFGYDSDDGSAECRKAWYKYVTAYTHACARCRPLRSGPKSDVKSEHIVVCACSCTLR